MANINLLDPDSASNKRKITIKEKQKILKLEEDFTLEKILKALSKVEKDIHSGLNKDENEKFIIEKMESTKKLIKWSKKHNLQPSFDLANGKDLDLLQKIFEIGVKVQNKKDRFEEFKQEANKTSDQSILVGLSDEALTELSQLPI